MQSVFITEWWRVWYFLADQGSCWCLPY